jgi:cytochrome P450
MFGYFAQLIAAKRESPADDLLSALILARDDGSAGEGDALTEHELYAMLFLPIGDTVIPAGESVTLVTSSANWDPERFGDPDWLDLSRDASGHLAFGHGIHYCLGAPLARLEGEVAIGSLLARCPGLALAVPPSELRWRHSSLIHGLESLPVRLG